ncbi:hypothetical protein EcWSU1_01767 [Enterobacter ludwigii]|uniref:Uncharacterized protein n=1 Tax=Enterobacter ludwigii TaxID=299767 RepID=G8LKH2_9ENTR|nr:hypothetical protein EcWSU1_01767 [Enterobacter ludwigii]
MARARLGFSAINNRIELTDLNHRSATARGHQFTDRRQGNTILCGRRLNVGFSVWRDRQQQTTGRLRIAQQIAPRFRHFAHQMTIAGKVTLGTARNGARCNVLLHTRQLRHVLIPDLRLYARALTHFGEVSEKAKTGHVGHGFHAVDIRKGRTREVHLAHDLGCQPLVFRLQQRFFLRSSEDTNAQRFGEEQLAARLCGAVAFHALGGHHARDRETEDRLRRIDRMPPGQRDPRLLAGKTSPFNHLTGNFRGKGVDRPAQNGNRHNRFAPHGENIADGVGGRNTPEIERVVDNRHKEVGGTDNAGAVTQVINCRIVTRFVTDKQVRVDKLRLFTVENGLQHFRGNFTTATGSVAVLR